MGLVSWRLDMAEQRTTTRMVVIVGPTAGGKSELAVGLALRAGGEIVNADSMQVYRGMEAGTAKPTPQQKAAAPHHLIDVVEPTEPWTVHDWLREAERVIGEIEGRGKRAIVVGGTNLYLKALLEGLFDGPGADEAFRRSVEDQSSAQLHERLMRVDAESAGRIHRNDRKRIVRALEVFAATGRPISQQQTQWDEAAEGGSGEGRYRHDPILIGLHWPTELINRRINARCKAMFDPPAGVEDLVSETRRLRDAGLLGPQAREALGTKQVLEHLAGRLTRAEALERVKIETRRFAKAQRTWLKRYRGVHWLDASVLDESQRVEAAAGIVLSGAGGGGV